MPELTDLSYVRALCEKYDFALSKGFGQNFIVNPGLPPKIVDASGVDKRYGVLEIGPGIGVLTRELAKRAAKVVSIEVDERLPPLLAETMAGVDNFKLVLQDVLKVDLKALIAQEFPGMPVAVCANLPYYITSPIVMKLLGDRLPIESLTVMVQKEAAQRLCAAPGSREVGAVSIAVQYYSQPQVLFQVSRGSFMPSPDVDSTVIRLDVRQQRHDRLPQGGKKFVALGDGQALLVAVQQHLVGVAVGRKVVGLGAAGGDDLFQIRRKGAEVVGALGLDPGGHALAAQLGEGGVFVGGNLGDFVVLALQIAHLGFFLLGLGIGGCFF